MIYIPITRTRQESVKRFLSAEEASSLSSFEFLIFFVHAFSLFQLDRIALAILMLVELAILLSPQARDPRVDIAEAVDGILSAEIGLPCSLRIVFPP